MITRNIGTRPSAVAIRHSASSPATRARRTPTMRNQLSLRLRWASATDQPPMGGRFVKGRGGLARGPAAVLGVGGLFPGLPPRRPVSCPPADRGQAVAPAPLAPAPAPARTNERDAAK